ncbi:MAG: hypothetical protein IJL23_00295 [Alphaproteobacteria bacterium]|nr:hypothetical protein [Alphaproteobacteria bacterium]
MKSYAQRYEEFTAATVKLAEQIHNANREKVMNAKYTLPQITAALRNIYKDPIFHEKFVSSKMSENKWSSGFCAMASVIIYEIYGGENVWNLMAVRPSDWERGSVVFLQDKATGINFGTTGEHFYPKTIPYDIGKPLDPKKLKTPHKETFKNVLMVELARLNKNSKK